MVLYPAVLRSVHILNGSPPCFPASIWELRLFKHTAHLPLHFLLLVYTICQQFSLVLWASLGRQRASSRT
jgi:hypothetical protein